MFDRHTVFGKVVNGMDVVAKIEVAQTGANDLPVKPIVAEEITIK